jgi:hypothetical protein
MHCAHDTLRHLGQALRQKLALSQALPPELQALLLRLAQADAERRHYGAPGRNAA